MEGEGVDMETFVGLIVQSARRLALHGVAIREEEKVSQFMEGLLKPEFS